MHNVKMGAVWQRNPETLFRNWPHYQDEAKSFLAWIRAKGSKKSEPYAPASLYRYMVEFKKYCNIMYKIGKNRELTYQDYLYIRSSEKTSICFPDMLKLYYIKYLLDFAEEDSKKYIRLKRLYEKIKIVKKKSKMPYVLTKKQVADLINATGQVGSLELKTLVSLTYETGARIGEIFLL